MDILSYKEFEEKVLHSEKPVLVDFYSDRCGPCRMMSPVIKELSDNSEDFLVYKVNVDNIYEAAEKFSVSSIPTFIAFGNGAETARIVGTASKQKLIELIGAL